MALRAQHPQQGVTAVCIRFQHQDVHAGHPVNLQSPAVPKQAAGS
jgi:hypothetical protein